MNRYDADVLWMQFRYNLDEIKKQFRWNSDSNECNLDAI